MTSTLLKAALPCASVLFVTLISPTVSAQLDAGAAPAALSSSDFTLSLERFDQTSGAWVKLNPNEQAYFFDRARCECAGDATNYTGSFRVAIEPAAAAVPKLQTLLAANPAGGSARLYAGGNAVNCLDAAGANASNLPAYCLNLLDPSTYAASIPGGMAVFVNQRIWESPPIPVAWLFNSTGAPVCGSAQACNAASACGSTRAAQTIYFWAQTSASGLPDSADLAFPVNLVGNVLYAPTNVTVEAANEALIVGWGWPAGTIPAADPSFLGVQLFCQRGEDYQVFSAGSYAAAFIKSAELCPTVAPAASPPLAFSNLDPLYLCSGLLPASATSARIVGLQNGIAYGVGVAAVDKYGNLSPLAPTDIVYNFPSASTLDGGAVDGGGHVDQGGGCTLAAGHEPHGRLASVVLLALGALLFARGRSRRR